jgi:hypothetical protein
MIWALPLFAFLATAFIAVVVFYVFSQRREIWEAVRKAQQERAEVSGWRRQQEPDRRRSERMVLRVPVLVFGEAINEEPFFEETTTLEVNAHGGLLNLTARVKTGQRLSLVNRHSRKEQKCHVVRVGRQHPKKTDVAVEFAQPVRDFWQTES